MPQSQPLPLRTPNLHLPALVVIATTTTLNRTSMVQLPIRRLRFHQIAQTLRGADVTVDPETVNQLLIRHVQPVRAERIRMAAQPAFVAILVRLFAQVVAEAASEGRHFAGRAAELRVAARRDPAASSAVHSRRAAEVGGGKGARFQLVFDVALLTAR